MKIFLKNFQSPGDILMLTAAVRDLKKAVPELSVNVATSAPDLWANNPYLDRSVSEYNADRVISIGYPLIHQSDRLPYHFIHAFRKELELQLGIRIPQGDFHGDLHLSDDEKKLHPLVESLCLSRTLPSTPSTPGTPRTRAPHPSQPSQPSPCASHLSSLISHNSYWLIDAGYKSDFTLKNWSAANCRKVVEILAGKVSFVQIGARDPGHRHPNLPGVLDLTGKTSIRDLVRIMYHASGVLTPVSFPMHLAAAVPTPDGRLRPCVVVAGGREPVTWEAYPGHQFLHTVGAFSCCRAKACWKSRAARLDDGSEKDSSLCLHPVSVAGETIGACMAAISPETVASIIQLYHGNR